VAVVAAAGWRLRLSARVGVPGPRPPAAATLQAAAAPPVADASMAALPVPAPQVVGPPPAAVATPVAVATPPADPAPPSVARTPTAHVPRREHDVVTAALAAGAFAHAWKLCAACPPPLRAALAKLAQPPADLPAALAAVAALVELRQQGMLPAGTYSAALEQRLAQAEPLLADLIEQGLPGSAKRALERFAATLPGDVGALRRLQVGRHLEQLAEREAARGHSLVGVNPDAARSHYQTALALAPHYSVAAARVRDALRALP